jgi:hypothetical protein
MADWLLLLNERVSADDTVAALRAAVPPPWDRLLLLGVARRWRPMTSGVPIGYRAERSKALRLVWAEQEDELRTRLDEVSRALNGDAGTVEVRVVWGDPVDGAHQEARLGDVRMIVYPVEWYRRVLDYWPGGMTWRLVRNAPCAVLLARLPRRVLVSDSVSVYNTRPWAGRPTG